MATLAPRRIPNVVFGLTLFWGGVLSAFFWTSGFNFFFLLPWVCSIFAGAWVGNAQSEEFKQARLLLLKYRQDLVLPVNDRAAFKNSERGVISSLGPVPFFVQPLSRLQSYEFSDLLQHAPQELVANNGLSRLLGKFLGPTARAKNSDLTAIFDALALTHLHPDNLRTPAGIDKHAGRSLLTHSLLVTALMAHRAGALVYAPRGVHAIDTEFKLDPLDPLIPILGMSHDLGKIRKMTLGPDGKAISLEEGHEAQCARDMALLPEFWAPAIDPETRRIIQTALAYSGRVDDTPIQRIKKDGYHQVTSDRLHALQLLLAECDRLASSIEMGGRYDFKVAARSQATAPASEVVEPINLLGALTKYLAIEMPVNARKGTRSVGFKQKDPVFTQDRHVIIIDELEFSKSFAHYLQHPDLGEREGKSSLIANKVLEVLDENGYLYRLGEEGESTKRPAKSCLYKIAFRDSGAGPEAPSGLVLSSAFLIDVTDWPNMKKLQDIPNCQSVPSLAGFRLGKQVAKASRRSAAEDIAEEALSGEVRPIGTDLEVLARSKSSSKKAPSPKQIINRINVALCDASKPLVVAAHDDSALAIVGQEDFFQALGLEIRAYDVLPDLHRQVGILKITESLKSPGSHVIRLDRSVYQGPTGPAV